MLGVFKNGILAKEGQLMVSHSYANGNIGIIMLTDAVFKNIFYKGH